MSYSGASVDVVARTSLHGNRLGLAANGNLVALGIPITSNAADATITLPASQASGYTLTVQFNNADGTAIAHCQPFRIRVALDANGSALATTGGTTGLAIGSFGKIDVTVTAKKVFDCVTDITGKFTATWTDTGSETAYLAVILPSGRSVISGNLLAT